MKSRFKPDLDRNAKGPPVDPGYIDPDTIDPDTYDASEQLFSASLDEILPPAAFHVDEGESSQIPAGAAAAPAISEQTAEAPVEAHAEQAPDCSWKQEVAQRVTHYRSRRRPREPRYPSLFLKFESADPDPGAASPESRADALVNLQSVVEKTSLAPVHEATARVLEFPRSAMAPPVPLEELAEPVLSRPRILEVPEVTPPPPALGGILMAASEVEPTERRPGFEIPLQPAPLSRRLGAAAVDAALVASGFVQFAYIFFRVTRSPVPSLPQAIALSGILGAVLWATYQYSFFAYTGTTPGLRIAKLRLSKFDGAPVPRRTRCWRALASILSGASLGLGYAWCFLDEDRLCWHDRITKTYIAPQACRPA